ncbi:NAD(P)-binding protein [Meredithblackwellia eburnea MCA 4105]
MSGRKSPTLHPRRDLLASEGSTVLLFTTFTFCAPLDTELMAIFDASRLKGKTVLITGGSSGIGAATAILFGRAGANVIVTGRRKDRLEEVAAEIKAANREGGTGTGGQVASLELDMRDRAKVNNIFELLPAALRKIDVLVNNAGMVFGREFVGEIAESDVDAAYETNVLGMICLTQVVVKAFKRQHSGHIIFVSSVSGKEPYAGGSVYCSTKAAVESFSGALMRELVNTPLRTTLICPGFVETEFSIVRFRGDKEQASAVYRDIQPLVAKDVAEEIVWAASRPEHVNIADVVVYPSCQASALTVHRGSQQ